MQDITSYDAGVGGSNGGAATLGSFRPREGRERFLESHTGNDVTFRGNYGAPLTHASPQLVGPDGQTLLQAPGSDGTPGRNIIGAYDLTRMNAMAAWHHDLKPDQRIDGAQWHSLESVMRAMGEDSARYVDAAIQRLEMGDQLKDVVVATKLGHGPANGKAETVYSGVVEFTDTRQSPPVRRSVSFTLKGVHGDAVELDARMASEVTELMRRVLDGSL
jgi:hypothetical protein